MVKTGAESDADKGQWQKKYDIDFDIESIITDWIPWVLKVMFELMFIQVSQSKYKCVGNLISIGM